MSEELQAKQSETEDQKKPGQEDEDSVLDKIGKTIEAALPGIIESVLLELLGKRKK